MRHAEPEATAFFNERAGSYDRAYDAADSNGHALRARMRTVLGLLGPGPGELLDAGMGPGRLCAELAAEGWTVSGIDAAEEMVANARQRLPDAADRLLRAEIEALPFPSERFDAVVATGVLEYADVPRALAELTRVLRPNGRAVVSYPNPRAFYGVWKTRVFYPLVRLAKRVGGRPPQELPRGSSTILPGRFRQLLEAVGLEPDDTVYTSYLVVPSPLDDLVPGLVLRLGRRLEGSGLRAGRRLATQVVYSAGKRAP